MVGLFMTCPSYQNVFKLIFSSLANLPYLQLHNNHSKIIRYLQLTFGYSNSELMTRYNSGEFDAEGVGKHLDDID